MHIINNIRLIDAFEGRMVFRPGIFSTGFTKGDQDHDHHIRANTRCQRPVPRY